MSSGIVEEVGRPLSLSRQPNFLKLWASESISSFGAQFSELAIPLTAVLVLQSSPTELGLLNAAVTAPFLIFSLIVGVWVDRHKRKEVMITSNLCRVALLGMIPFAAAVRILTLPLLFGVAFSVGVLRVFFDIAYQSYLPGLVSREQLVDANSRLEASRAVSSVAGPGVAGTIIQIITAPFAIAFDSISFLFSTLILGSINSRESIEPDSNGSPVLSEVREGLRVVLQDSRLLSLAGSAATANFFEFSVQAIFLLYAVNTLALNSGEIGFVLSLGAIGAVVGALAAGELARRIGVGPAILSSMTLGSATWAPLMLIADRTTAIPLLIIAWFLGEVSFVVWSINSSSFRQAICPAQLQGRMNATFRFLTAGVVPLGSITGGILGEVLGLRLAIGVSAIGLIIAPLWIVLSPVRKMKKVSDSELGGEHAD